LKKPRLLIVEPESFSSIARVYLEGYFEIYQGPLTRKKLLSSIHYYDALMIRLGHKFDEEMLISAKSLKVIGTPTTGLNHLDASVAKRLGISIVSLQGEREFLDEVFATAEYTWGLLLALLRKIPAATSSVKAGGWARDLFRGSELHGKILGVIGCGRLGTMVAGYGRAFGMQVISYDPYVTTPYSKNCSNLHELAASADIVSLHVSYDESTHKMLAREFFENLKLGAFLINTSRGELIDECALLNSLKEGRIAGAALDVLCVENAMTSPAGSLDLIDYARTNDNLLITPHIAGATHESMEKTEIFIARKLINCFGNPSIVL
jgi:D-3-phosphoglycerate dehydrogenase